MSEQMRDEELDIMKGIGIILIILGHLEPGTYLMRFVYSFHLFLFFVCSGFVGRRYEKRKYSAVIHQNVKRLLLPYLVWSVLSQMIDLLTGSINICQAIKNILFFDANVGWNAALWFLEALFWADTICAMIVKLPRWMQIFCGVVLLGMWYLLAKSRIVLPFGLYTVPVAAFFWLAGYWMNTYGVLRLFKEMSILVKIAWGGGISYSNHLLRNDL